MAARKNKVKLTHEWKERIQISQIMNRLMKCFDGNIELRQDQLKAIEIVLKKVVPDLARTESNVNMKISDSEWLDKLKNAK